MLQQETPEDFVIASGVQYSVRDFVDAAASELGLGLRWKGEGVDEIGIVATVDEQKAPESARSLAGKTIVRVDPRYFRPTEVETLLGDPTKAREKLGWTPKTTFSELVSEMVLADLEDAQRDELCKTHGFKAFDYHE
jgi:GDPmannose 4,6-dehydratase